MKLEDVLDAMVGRFSSCPVRDTREVHEISPPLSPVTNTPYYFPTAYYSSRDVSM